MNNSRAGSRVKRKVNPRRGGAVYVKVLSLVHVCLFSFSKPCRRIKVGKAGGSRQRPDHGGPCEPC